MCHNLPKDTLTYLLPWGLASEKPIPQKGPKTLKARETTSPGEKKAHEKARPVKTRRLERNSGRKNPPREKEIAKNIPDPPNYLKLG